MSSHWFVLCDKISTLNEACGPRDRMVWKFINYMLHYDINLTLISVIRSVFKNIIRDYMVILRRLVYKY